METIRVTFLSMGTIRPFGWELRDANVEQVTYYNAVADRIGEQVAATISGTKETIIGAQGNKTVVLNEHGRNVLRIETWTCSAEDPGYEASHTPLTHDESVSISTFVERFVDRYEAAQKSVLDMIHIHNEI